MGGAYSFVSLHVEALDPVGSIHLRQEERMETDDDRDRDKYSPWIQRSLPGHSTGIEGKGNSGYLPTCFVAPTARGCIEALNF